MATSCAGQIQLTAKIAIAENKIAKYKPLISSFILYKTP
jgi:hypothetical protein